MELLSVSVTATGYVVAERISILHNDYPTLNRIASPQIA